MACYCVIWFGCLKFIIVFIIIFAISHAVIFIIFITKKNKGM